MTCFSFSETTISPTIVFSWRAKVLAIALLFLTLITTVSTAPTDSGKRQAVKLPLLASSKYFYEAGSGSELGHYDQRYFAGAPVSYEVKGDTLRHMIRAYLTTFRQQNIDTWIAHGTLIGWYWNGRLLPWDWDLDVQVTGNTMAYLRENLNMTIHNYTAEAEDGSTIFRQYLLDVNPHSVEKFRGDGLNIIDARWIDVRNGLFIDITALHDTQPEIWGDKNGHYYATGELLPLRNTTFEDVPALIPHSYVSILAAEYGRTVLTSTNHQGCVPFSTTTATYTNFFLVTNGILLKSSGSRMTISKN